MYKNLDLVVKNNTPKGVISWKVPSNIALVKYWGKFGDQYPMNPSISLTLENAYTVTKLHYSFKNKVSNSISLKFEFEGKENDLFRNKIIGYFEKLTDIYPFIYQFDFFIESKNSFPHSSGIASSASSMAALALCLVSLEQRLFGSPSSKKELNQKSSYIARLGSGSACRSIFPVASIWGTTAINPQASNDYGIGVADDLHPIFQTMHNDILIISAKKKSVSSTAGHQLMENNIYANTRFEQAKQNLKKITACLKSGDLDTYITIVEEEALTLHALMMTSDPSFILMHPNSLAAINEIRAFRKATKLPLCFTLDAGPNIHLMYPDKIKSEIRAFIKEILLPFCQNGLIIEDRVGKGPILINNE